MVQLLTFSEGFGFKNQENNKVGTEGWLVIQMKKCCYSEPKSIGFIIDSTWSTFVVPWLDTSQYRSMSCVVYGIQFVVGKSPEAAATKANFEFVMSYSLWMGP